MNERSPACNMNQMLWLLYQKYQG